MPDSNYKRPIRVPTRQELAEKKYKKEAYLYPMESLLLSLRDVPFLHGELISEEIQIGTGETTIKHGLGREAFGYLILSQDAPSIIYRVPLNLPVPTDEAEEKEQERIKNSTIILKASESVTVRLWVFGFYKKPPIPLPRKKPTPPI